MRDQERAAPRDPGNCAEALLQGRFIRQADEDRYPIPGRLNLVLATAEIVAAFAILGVASHARSLWGIFLFAVGFTFLMQLGFGLAHEAAHGKLHPSPRVNEAFGICLYSLFPGSYHLFAIAHLVHHQRNRSDAELEDYILPGETPWLKRVTYYLLLCGLFWLLTPPTVLAIAMWPGESIRMPAPDSNAGVASRYLQFFNSVNPGRVRRDSVSNHSDLDRRLAAFPLQAFASRRLLCGIRVWLGEPAVYLPRAHTASCRPGGDRPSPLAPVSTALSEFQLSFDPSRGCRRSLDLPSADCGRAACTRVSGRIFRAVASTGTVGESLASALPDIRPAASARRGRDYRRAA